MRGDLLFYAPERRNLFGRLIAHATKGPYCHVEIDLGDGRMLGATLRGVGYRPYAEPARRVSPPNPPATAEDIEHGIAWAEAHIGKPYGVLDIVSNALKLLGLSLYLGERDAFDCSELAAHFLDESGVELGDLEETYNLISPNDLARLLS